MYHYIYIIIFEQNIIKKTIFRRSTSIILLLIYKKSVGKT